jgi:hypothetical protein
MTFSTFRNKKIVNVLLFFTLIICTMLGVTLLNSHKAFAQTLNPDPALYVYPFIKTNFENPSYTWPQPEPIDASCGQPYEGNPGSIIVNFPYFVARPDTISPPSGATTTTITYVMQTYICINGGGDWPDANPQSNPTLVWWSIGDTPLSPGGATFTNGIVHHGFFSDEISKSFTVPVSSLTPGCKQYDVPWNQYSDSVWGPPGDAYVNLCYNPPPPVTDTPPTGSLTLACQPDGTTLVTPKWKDVDGTDNNAYDTVINPDSTNLGNFVLANRVPKTLTAAADPGATIDMYVNDVLPGGGSNGYKLVWFGTAPNCPKHVPVFTSATATCGPPARLRFKVSDPLASADPMTNVNVLEPNGVTAYPTLSGSTYKLDISSFSGSTTQAFTISATDFAGTTTTTVILPACVSPPITCSLLGGNTEPANTAFSIDPTVTYTYGGTLPNPGTTPLRVNINFIPVFNQSVPYTATHTLVTVNPALTFGPEPVGAYTITITFEGQTCHQTLNIANSPYLSIVGGDAMAGSSFYTSDTCDNSGNSNSNIESFTQGGGHSSAGSGSQFAAYALGTFNGFATAQNTTDSNGLSFANIGAHDGNFSSVPCANDYYNTYKNVSSANSFTSLLTVNALDDDTVVTHGQIVIDVVKDANVVINANVTYDTESNEISQLPQFKLIVYGGNIYINNAVTQLDGLYVAEPDPAQPPTAQGGIIYDCANGTTQESPDNPNYNADCNNQLIFNGALVANDVKFMRTYGNLASATSDDHVAGNCTTAGSCIGNGAAEVVNFNPLVWMVSPLTSQSSSSYDSIVDLPPVL